MGVHVNDQVTSAGKPLPAGQALVRFLPLVVPYVDNKQILGAKVFTADVAVVRLLARVGPHVPLQLGRLYEGLAAGVAGEGLTRVSPHVILQTAAKSKALSAGFTGKRPLPCVDPFVRHEQRSELKDLSTKVTRERRFSRAGATLTL